MMPPPDKNTSVFPHGHIDRSGWKRVRLGDVGYTYNGLSGKTKQDFDAGDAFYIPFLNVLENTEIDINNLGRVNVSALEKQTCVQKNDLFFNTSSETPEEVGMCAYLSQELSNTFLNSFCFGFRLYNIHVAEPRFLVYLFNSAYGRRVISSLAQGVTRYNLSKERLLQSDIHLPPVTEQLRIASCINIVEKNLVEMQTLISKYDAIKKATVNLLLKPKAGWNKIRLADFESHRNNTCSRSLTSSSKGNVHNIHYGDILVNFGEIVSMKYDHVDCLSEEGEACSPKDYLQDGDIVIADTAEDETAGKVIEVQDVEGQKAVAGLHTVFLRPPSNLFARGWLGYWMNSRFYHDQLLPYMTGIKVLSLSKSSIANTEICYPAMEKQKHIVGILKSIDTHIATLQAQACKARQLKDGVMSYFFG